MISGSNCEKSNTGNELVLVIGKGSLFIIFPVQETHWQISNKIFSKNVDYYLEPACPIFA
jgi:hypothetical protein